MVVASSGFLSFLICKNLGKRIDNPVFSLNSPNAAEYVGERVISSPLTSITILGEKSTSGFISFGNSTRRSCSVVFKGLRSSIIVFKTSNTSIKPSIDLYLTKKKPFLRTESVFLRTGYDLNKDTYNNTLMLIKQASEFGIWTGFVTTPIGILKIGLEKLISDMEDLNVWLYVVDPGRKKIFGLIKAKKNENYNTTLRDEVIKRLPREPIRVPSRVLKISEYEFNISESYDPEDFGLFEISTEVQHNKLVLKDEQLPKYTKIFKDLIIIERLSGKPIISYSSENFKDQALTSGFLSAMDSFAAEISGTASMKDINYKGFYVQASNGDFVKIACFLSEPADESLRERLDYFIKFFEEKYQDKIVAFIETGNMRYFNKEEILNLIKEILDI